MIAAQNRAESGAPASHAKDIELVAELAIAHLTRSKMLWNYCQFSDVHPDYECDQITPHQYLEAAVDATASRCALMSTWTGNFLRAAYPGRFTHMFLFRSKVPSDTPQGRAESEEWVFDTWLVLQDNDGRYYVLSPALHDEPEDEHMVEVFESDTMEGAVAHINAQRPGWDWASAAQAREFMATHSTDPDSFYSYDSSMRLPHAATCLTLTQRGSSNMIDPTPVRFEKLDVYA